MKVRTSLFTLALVTCMGSLSLAQIDANSSNCATVSAGVGECTETESLAGIPSLNEDFLFDAFDPSVGTLQSIKVKVEISSSEGALAVDNDSLEGGSGDIQFGIQSALTSTEVSLFSSLAPPTQIGAGLSTVATSSITLTGDDGDQADQGSAAEFNSGGSDYSSFTPANASDMKMGLIDSGLWGGFVLGSTADTNSNGAIDLHLDASQFSDFGSLGGVAAQIIPQNVAAEVMVTYTYEPVPEPQAWALVSGAAMLLLTLRRRRS